MEIKLNHRHALVGGSTSGLGKAIAMQLAQCGASVTLLARNETSLKKVVTALPYVTKQKHGYLVADFSEPESFREKVSAFLQTNPVDILINNTNGPEAGSVLDKKPADYQVAFDLLFQTFCHITMEALPYMQKNGFGRIINVSSMSVVEPLQHLALSNTIRAAVINWAKTLATDVAKDNITVNNIITGYFNTERLQDLIQFQAKNNNITPAEMQQRMEANVPMQRFGKPEEYGSLIAFLVSDYASYITGTNIRIDGGLLKSI